MQHISNSDWRTIPGFPKYAITPEGQVWSYYTNKFLKPYQDHYGYLIVDLRNDLGPTTCKIHRLVGMAFIPLPDEFNNDYSAATINHIDHNKENNHYSNLAWVTREYNTQEAWDNGYCDHRKKSCFLIDSLYNTYTPFNSCADIDRHLNLSINTAGHAIRRYNGLIRGRYIAGYLDDPRWKGVPANPTIEQIVESYADQIECYKSRNIGPKKITNLQTGDSKIYNALTDFAREHGLNPSHISSYLKARSDLYRVELV